MTYILILYVLFVGASEPSTQVTQVASVEECLKHATAFLSTDPKDVGALAVGAQCVKGLKTAGLDS